MKRIEAISILLALVLATGVFSSVTPSASASLVNPNLRNQVVNSSGIPQAGVYVYDATSGQVVGETNGSGKVVLDVCQNDSVLSSVMCTLMLQDDTFYYSREGTAKSDDPCQQAPERWPGVSYANVNSANAVVLPQVAGVAHDPSLSPEERGLVGVINQQRIAEGFTPVTISSTLSVSADRYIGDLPARPLDYSADSTYCMASGPGIRALDSGFPTSDGIDETVAVGAPNAAAALAQMTNSPHQAALTDPQVTMLGIAQVGGTWVIDTSTLPANDPYYVRAGDSGDSGDASLVISEFPPPPTDPGDADYPGSGTTPSPGNSGDDDSGTNPHAPGTGRKTAATAPRLSIDSAATTGQVFRGTVSLPAKARGTIRAFAVSRRSKSDRVVMHVYRRGGNATITGRLHPGHWLLKIHFDPSQGARWKAVTTVRRITVHARHRH